MRTHISTAVIAWLLVAVGVAGCTTMRVSPLPSGHVRHVCIEKNPAVIIDDFLPTLEENFARHGFSTEVYAGGSWPDGCELRVAYTARQTWDIVRLMSHAEVTMYDAQEMCVATGVFHLVGGGGYALTKYASVRTKMRPVMDKMLSSYALTVKPKSR